MQAGDCEQRREDEADAGVDRPAVTDEEPIERMERRGRARTKQGDRERWNEDGEERDQIEQTRT